MPLLRDLPGRPDERVLRQFVAALLFEELIDAEVADIGDRRHFLWRLKGRSYRCQATIGAFGRIRIMPTSIEALGDDGFWREADLRALLEGLPGTVEDRNRLLGELEQTAFFSRWNDANLARVPRRSMPFAEIDAALDEGHSYHPCFKARTGFDESDHQAYGPEAGNCFQLVWLSVACRYLDQSLPCDETEFWIAEIGEEGWNILSERRRALGVDASQFGLLPLHPWQWEKLRDDGLAGLIADGEVHFLGSAGDRYRASQSVRSLLNTDRPDQAGVKLAMNLVNTSSLRTIEPHSVCVAPVLSRWITAIVSGDPAFRSRYPLAVLSEYAGVVFDRDGPLAGQLAAIWRESVDSHLRPGEAAAPLNALMVIDHDGRPFADEWIERYGLSGWLDKLLDVVVMPVWHLLVGHGIATEAHGQNLVLVHRNGWPTRLILRDLHDSVEYVPDYLRNRGAEPDFPALDLAYRNAEPNQFYWMDSIGELRELVVDCLFIYNLSEISDLLSERYGLPEQEFWARVESRLRRYASEHDLQLRQDQLRLGGEEIFTESLLSRKLHPSRSEHRHRVLNSLGLQLIPCGEQS
ncbi:IucA/IucC family protein [Flaviflagellibacter deserti]|uniref:IucA/IucC family protein n=1 Tax=Flaviflagellibacter deserti TaxID=2267266 RepID=A0ABV9Z0B2_9HYPH